MHAKRDIKSVEELTRARRLRVPEGPGVYAFWWIDERSKLLAGNRQIVLKGPGGKAVSVAFDDWWPEPLGYPCLYVGKSTNLKKRFGQHLMRSSSGRVHRIPKSGREQKPATTSCQLRYGIEHVFPKETEPLALIAKSVGFSYRAYESHEIAERFFEEDRLIGKWRPWFNVDSER